MLSRVPAGHHLGAHAAARALDEPVLPDRDEPGVPPGAPGAPVDGGLGRGRARLRRDD